MRSIMLHLILFLGLAPLLIAALFVAINGFCELVAIFFLYIEQIIRERLFNIQ